MDENRLATCHYCPACGEQSYTPLPVILPGQYDWKCPKCETWFRIDIGFYEMDSHTETIICPECGRIQIATVEHTFPWHSYIHECKCGYVITESEWEEEVDGGKERIV